MAESVIKHTSTLTTKCLSSILSVLLITLLKLVLHYCNFVRVGAIRQILTEAERMHFTANINFLRQPDFC